MSIEIVPTVMPDSHDDFVDKINKVATYVKTIQIDVMDGKFVPSKSWPYKTNSDTDWENYINGINGLPHWEDIDFEVDLMVYQQIEEAKKWIQAGAMRVICHVEALKEGEGEEFLKLKEEFNIEIYLALIPETSLSILDPYLDKIDGIQFMGINKIGYQGQAFEPKVLEMISEIRGRYPNLAISVDGGVSFETTKDLVEAGATSLASGSVIFNATSAGDAIEELKEVANS